jgi:sugar fermentation stimulation protein A
MFYLVQREDCNRLSIAGDIDPNYANAFIAARKAGVEMLCYGCSISPEAIKIRRKLEIVI